MLTLSIYDCTSKTTIYFENLFLSEGLIKRNWTFPTPHKKQVFSLQVLCLDFFFVHKNIKVSGSITAKFFKAVAQNKSLYVGEDCGPRVTWNTKYGLWKQIKLAGHEHICQWNWSTENKMELVWKSTYIFREGFFYILYSIGKIFNI